VEFIKRDLSFVMPAALIRPAFCTLEDAQAK
jgi:hypothetical protein